MPQKLCWDCPKRKGISRIYGEVMQMYAEFRSDAHERISKRRGSCVGRIPVQAYIFEGLPAQLADGTASNERPVKRYYEAGCAADYDTIPEVPVEVRVGFGFSGAKAFILKRMEPVEGRLQGASQEE